MIEEVSRFRLPMDILGHDPGMLAITVVVRSSVICLSSVIWRSFNIKKQILSSLIVFLLRGLLSRYLLHNLTPNSQPHLAVQMVENFRDSTVEPMIYM